jgi:hypothetical protein
MENLKDKAKYGFEDAKEKLGTIKDGHHRKQS